MRLFEGTEFDIPPRCDRCNALEEECNCPVAIDPVEKVDRNRQRVKVFSEKRKHGRMVTCVKGVHEADLADVLTELKNQFGCGGTIKNGVIELQGDHSDAARDTLRVSGFKVK